MSLKIWTVESPIGPWSIIADGEVVVVSGFESAANTAARLPADTPPPESVADLGEVSRAALNYLEGDVRALDAIEVAQPGGPFRQETWRVMREIRPGQTWSYTELATKAGNPAAVRAAASACANNRVAPFVPCHRVVRSDGSLGGYYYGLPAKEWLLSHEMAEGQRR